MNFSSRVYNQSAICYSESLGQHIHKLSFEERDSPKKKRDGSRISTTKEWVLRSFCTKSKASQTNNESTSAAPPLNPDHSAPSLVVEQKCNRPDKIPDRHEGDPAVFFKQSLVDSHGEKFKFCLVGKFSGGRRPGLELIREWVGKEWKLRGECSVTLLDSSHVFLRIHNQADMLYVWTKRRWFIGGNMMKVLKWTPNFRPSEGEPSLAALWVSFPLLPIVFFQEDLLFAIASAIGNRVFIMDEPTRKLTRTNVARVCMEVDLVKELPKRVWIGIGGGGFWQEVIYEKLPSYCNVCRRQGHSADTCRAAQGSDLSQEKVKDSNSSLKCTRNSRSKKSGSQVQFSLGERDGIGPRSQNRDEISNGSRKEGSCCLRSVAFTESEEVKVTGMTNGSKGEASCIFTAVQRSHDHLSANGVPDRVVLVSRNEIEIKAAEYDLRETGAEKVQTAEGICQANDHESDRGKEIFASPVESQQQREELPTIPCKNIERKTSKEGDVHAEIGKRVLGSLLKDEDKEALNPMIVKNSPERGSPSSPSTTPRRQVLLLPFAICHLQNAKIHTS